MAADEPDEPDDRKMTISILPIGEKPSDIDGAYSFVFPDPGMVMGDGSAWIYEQAWMTVYPKEKKEE